MINRKLSLALIPVIVLLAISSLALAEENPFNYNPNKIEPGTMYTYQLFTSSDQKQAQRKIFYYTKFLHQDKLGIGWLSVKTSGTEDINYVKYILDLDHMMLKSSHFQSFTKLEDMPLNTTWEAKSEVDFTKKENNFSFTNKYKDGLKTQKRTFAFNHIPTFFYYTQHVDAWTVMRFYPYSKKRLDVWNYTGNKLTGVKIKYQGEEVIEVPAGTIRCHKFKMSGKGILAWLFGKKAHLWMSAEDERNFMVHYKNNNEKGSWPMIDLRLAKVEKLSEKEWEEKVIKADKRKDSK